MKKPCVEDCFIDSNVAHKVRRYERNVASGPVPDVLDLLRKPPSRVVGNVSAFGEGLP